MATTLAKRTQAERDPEVRYINPDVVTYDELKIGNDILKSGDKIRIKGDTRTEWRFRFLVHNIKLDSTWVELCSDMGFKAVRVDALNLSAL